MGNLFENGLGVDKCVKTAFRYFKRAADLGHAKSLTKCGNFAYSGKGILRANKTEAYKYYEKAKLLKETEAMNNMGLMLENGFDATLANPDLAKENFEMAHKLGNTDASMNLALLYMNGIYVVSDVGYSVTLMKTAAKSGNVKARDYLLAHNMISDI